VEIPKRGRGTLSAAAQVAYDASVQRFVDDLTAMADSLDFKMSARGWCYYLEGLGAIDKSEFSRAETVINDLRKSGGLPLDFTSEDSTRAPEGLHPYVSDRTPEEYARHLLKSVRDEAEFYTHRNFFAEQKYYVELLVEKGDLVGLFRPVCDEHMVSIASAKGWSDINSRANMMQRFDHYERLGCRPVLLYCGDHDPGGLHISDCLMSNLRDLSDAARWSPDNLIIDRFGLNYDFIEEHQLVWIDNLISSGGKDQSKPHKGKTEVAPHIRDYIARFGKRKVEANAMLSEVLLARQLCRDALAKYIDLAAVERFRAERKSHQDSIKKYIDEALAKCQ